MTDRIKKTIYKSKEILILDYSGCRDDVMMTILTEAKALILKEKTQILVLSILKGNYVTPKFVRHLEEELRDAEPFIEKNVVTGLSEIQKWILKGINLWYKKQLHYFDTVDEALEYLVS